MKKILASILGLLLLLAFSGCASMGKRTRCIVEGAVAGAAIGAGGGAVIGHQGDTDNATEGAFIGAAVGGIIGGFIGCATCSADAAVGDSDGDGVPDDADECPGTPADVKVNSKGCPLDSDGDGVPDYRDSCPGTSKGIKVDDMGCPLVLDEDGDGVPDEIDKCPATPKGATVNKRGCWAFTGTALFGLNEFDIRSDAYPLLDEAVRIMKANPEMRVEVQGHTDSTGTEAYNQMISEKRAISVKEYLISQGIESDRLVVRGYGESVPAESNETLEGRQRNRRVRFKVIR